MEKSIEWVQSEQAAHERGNKFLCSTFFSFFVLCFIIPYHFAVSHTYPHHSSTPLVYDSITFYCYPPLSRITDHWLLRRIKTAHEGIEETWGKLKVILLLFLSANWSERMDGMEDSRIWKRSPNSWIIATKNEEYFMLLLILVSFSHLLIIQFFLWLRQQIKFPEEGKVFEFLSLSDICLEKKNFILIEKSQSVRDESMKARGD